MKSPKDLLFITFSLSLLIVSFVIKPVFAYKPTINLKLHEHKLIKWAQVFVHQAGKIRNVGRIHQDKYLSFKIDRNIPCKIHIKRVVNKIGVWEDTRKVLLRKESAMMTTMIVRHTKRYVLVSLHKKSYINQGRLSINGVYKGKIFQKKPIGFYAPLYSKSIFDIQYKLSGKNRHFKFKPYLSSTKKPYPMKIYIPKWGNRRKLKIRFHKIDGMTWIYLYINKKYKGIISSRRPRVLYLKPGLYLIKVRRKWRRKQYKTSSVINLKKRMFEYSATYSFEIRPNFFAEGK